MLKLEEVIEFHDVGEVEPFGLNFSPDLKARLLRTAAQQCLEAAELHDELNTCQYENGKLIRPCTAHHFLADKDFLARLGFAEYLVTRPHFSELLSERS